MCSIAKLFNFYDPFGNHLQLGESDYFRAAFPGYNFPDIGVYLARVANFECFTCPTGYAGFNNGKLGTVTVADVPEPSIFVLFLAGALLILMVKLRLTVASCDCRRAKLSARERRSACWRRSFVRLSSMKDAILATQFQRSFSRFWCQHDRRLVAISPTGRHTTCRTFR